MFLNHAPQPCSSTTLPNHATQPCNSTILLNHALTISYPLFYYYSKLLTIFAHLIIPCVNPLGTYNASLGRSFVDDLRSSNSYTFYQFPPVSAIALLSPSVATFLSLIVKFAGFYYYSKLLTIFAHLIIPCVIPLGTYNASLGRSFVGDLRSSNSYTFYQFPPISAIAS